MVIQEIYLFSMKWTERGVGCLPHGDREGEKNEAMHRRSLEQKE